MSLEELFPDSSRRTAEFVFDEINDEVDRDVLMSEWATSSRLLLLAVVGISALTLPALIFLLVGLRKYRKSQYSPFLCSIVVGNVVLLTSVLCNVISDQLNLFAGVLPGKLMCKLSAFFVNTSSSSIHWTWVAMYVQRFLHVFFPMRARRSLPRNSTHIIIAIAALSSIAQLWTFVFITELNEMGGAYCGGNPTIIGPKNVKWIAAVDCALTFFLPLLLTVLTDVSVLVLRNPCQSPQFKLVSTDDIGNNKNGSEVTMKIVSKHNQKFAEKRRALAIRRCCIAATVTLLLNLPNYLLQLVDEFYELREHNDISVRRLFLRIDAAVYILYLLQFPTVPIHMYILKEDISRSSSVPKPMFLAPLTKLEQQLAGPTHKAAYEYNESVSFFGVKVHGTQIVRNSNPHPFQKRERQLLDLRQTLVNNGI